MPQVPNVKVAGKTGTTNNNLDAWFCGYSPAQEVIVWFGRDNNRPLGKGGTGGAISHQHSHTSSIGYILYAQTYQGSLKFQMVYII